MYVAPVIEPGFCSAAARVTAGDVPAFFGIGAYTSAVTLESLPGWKHRVGAGIATVVTGEGGRRLLPCVTYAAPLRRVCSA
jgi:hypothetical protein